jgi:hypothetical protein
LLDYGDAAAFFLDGGSGLLVISPSSWPSSVAEHKRVIAPWLLFILTVAAAGAAVFASPLFLVVPIALLPVVATWAYPKSIWPFVPLTTIVISPSIFLVNGEPFEYDEAVQKGILIIGGLCLVVALGARWSSLGAAALTIVGIAAGYCVPWLFFFINWRALNLRKGLEYLAALPLMCLLAGVVIQLAGVKGPAYRAPFPGIFCIDHGVPRLQGALIAPHLAELALVALVAALVVLASPNPVRGYRIHFWVALNFIILMATVTRSEIAVGLVLILTYLVGAFARNRLRTLSGGWMMWPIAAVAVVGCAIAAPALIMRTTGSGANGTFNTSGRTYAWQFFQGFVAENPIAGKGLGFSSIAVKLYMSDYMSESFVETFRTPHNEYLRWLVDGGAFFALGLFVVIVSAFGIAARAQHGAVRTLVVVFALGTVAVSYVDNTFSTVQFSVPLVILLGLLAAHPSREAHSPGKHRAKTRDESHVDSLLDNEHDPASGVALSSAVAPAKR